MFPWPPLESVQSCSLLDATAAAEENNFVKVECKYQNRSLLVLNASDIVGSNSRAYVKVTVDIGMSDWDVFAVQKPDPLLTGVFMPDRQSWLDLFQSLASSFVCTGVPKADLGVYGAEGASYAGIDTHSHPRHIHSVDCQILFTDKQALGARTKRSVACSLLLKNVAARLKRLSARSSAPSVSSKANLASFSKQELTDLLKKCRQQLQDTDEKLATTEQQLAEKTAAVQRIQAQTRVVLAADLEMELAEKLQHIEQTPECQSALEELLARDKTGLLRSLFCENISHLLKRTSSMKELPQYSQHFIKVAMSIQLRSPAAARALNRSGLFAMPCHTTFTRYLKDYVPDLGFTKSTPRQLQREKDRYEAYGEHWTKVRSKAGLPATTPNGDGVLTFDEIVLRMGFATNAASEMTDGMMMTTEQLHNFDDVFRHLATGDPPPVRYIMASMWRCLDSDFQILGPIVASEKGLPGEGVYKYVLRTIEELHHFNFRTKITVCDGSSPNLKFLKMLCNIDTSCPERLFLQP